MAETTIKFNAQDNASADINKVKGAMDGATAAANLLGAALGAAGLLSVAKDSLKEFNAMEKGAKLLDATLKSTGKGAEITSKQIYDMAGALQDLTTYGDDVTVESARMLLTFQNLSTKELPRSIKAIQDMNIAMGGGEGSLKGVSMQVGKALNDPIQGLTTLRRVGIQFSEAQQDVIKKLVETGDMAGAQSIILGQLEQKFGGAAEAARDTFGGAVTSLKNSIGDAQEGIGKMIAEALLPLVKLLNDGVKAWNGLDETTKRVITTVAGVTVAVIAAVSAYKGMSEAIKLVNLAMTASPWGLALAAVVALTAGIVTLVGENNKYTKSLQDASDAQADLISNFENTTAEQATKNLTLQQTLFNDALEKGAKKLGVNTDELKALVSQWSTGKKTSSDLEGQFRNQEALLNSLTPLWKNLSTAMQIYNEKGGATVANEKKTGTAIKDNTALFSERSKVAQDYADKVFKQSASNIEVLKKEYADAMALLESHYGEAGKKTEEYQKRRLDTIKYHNEEIKKAEEKNTKEITGIYKKYQAGLAEESQKRTEKEQADFDQTVATVKKVVDEIMNIARTLTGMYTNQIDSINANLETRLAAIDESMQAELEAAGLADKTDKEQAEETLATLREKLTRSADEEETAAIQSEIIEAEKAARKAGIIEEYNNKKTQAEKAAALETYKVEKAAFETNKILSLIQVAIDTASGIMAGFAQLGPIGGGIAAVVTAGVGIAQAAVISGSQPPAPPAFADGGVMPYSGQALVGERGPELVNLPRGAEVITAEQTRGMMGGVNIYGPITIMANNTEQLRREILQIARYEGAL